MKYCPKCQTNYDDGSYEFCLQDGTLLQDFSNSEMPTIALNETETVVRNNYVEPTHPDFQNYQYQNSVQVQPLPNVPPIQSAPPKSNTIKVVLLTIFAMIALFGAGFGAWYFIDRRQTEIVENTNKNTNKNQNSTRSPTPKPSANLNVNVAKITPTPTPTPEFDAEQVKSEVAGTIEDWKSATEAGDINNCMNNYAETINFYGKQTSRAAVRSSKQDAFNKFDTMSISLSNMRVTPDASGEKATAVFDKEWSFIGEKVYEGKVQSQFQLIKSGEKWLITSEKDLKVYYVRK